MVRRDSVMMLQPRRISRYLYESWKDPAVKLGIHLYSKRKKCLMVRRDSVLMLQSRRKLHFPPEVWKDSVVKFGIRCLELLLLYPQAWILCTGTPLHYFSLSVGQGVQVPAPISLRALKVRLFLLVKARAEQAATLQHSLHQIAKFSRPYWPLQPRSYR